MSANPKVLNRFGGRNPYHERVVERPEPEPYIIDTTVCRKCGTYFWEDGHDLCATCWLDEGD